MNDAPRRTDVPPTCPICRGATSFSVDNRHRPFCSARCQMVDLGNWLGERYAVPGAEVSTADGAPVPPEQPDGGE